MKKTGPSLYNGTESLDVVFSISKAVNDSPLPGRFSQWVLPCPWLSNMQNAIQWVGSGGWKWRWGRKGLHWFFTASETFLVEKLQKFLVIFMMSFSTYIQGCIIKLYELCMFKLFNIKSSFKSLILDIQWHLPLSNKYQSQFRHSFKNLLILIIFTFSLYVLQNKMMAWLQSTKINWYINSDKKKLLK